MLSCDCYFDGEGEFVVPYGDSDFKPLTTKYSRKCGSCKERIPLGSLCIRFALKTSPRSEYEEKRFGEEVYLKDLYLCESCGEIWHNLASTGLCVRFGDMREALQEYWEMTGFDPKKYAQEAENA